MKYLYKCEHCGTTKEIEKPIKESSRIEHCDSCECELKRVYTASTIKTGDGVKG